MCKINEHIYHRRRRRVIDLYADTPLVAATVLDLDAAREKSPEALNAMREQINDIAGENSAIEFEEVPEP